MPTVKVKVERATAAAGHAPAPKKPAAKKKPVVKSAAAKKAAPVKKRVPVTRAGKTAKSHATCKAMCAPDESFWVNYGPIVSTLDELAEALRLMSDEQYMHHVPGDRNDFARWVREALSCEECATRLEKATSRLAAIAAIEECQG